MAAQGTSKLVLHAPVLGHFRAELGAHEPLDSKELGLLANALFGRMHLELVLPVGKVLGIVIGFDASARDPDTLSVRRLRIGQRVAVRGHDTTNRLVNVLVGSIRILGLWSFNRKGGNDSVVVETRGEKR